MLNSISRDNMNLVKRINYATAVLVLVINEKQTWAPRHISKNQEGKWVCTIWKRKNMKMRKFETRVDRKWRNMYKMKNPGKRKKTFANAIKTWQRGTKLRFEEWNGKEGLGEKNGVKGDEKKKSNWNLTARGTNEQKSKTSR